VTDIESRLTEALRHARQGVAQTPADVMLAAINVRRSALADRYRARRRTVATALCGAASVACAVLLYSATAGPAPHDRSPAPPAGTVGTAGTPTPDCLPDLDYDITIGGGHFFCSYGVPQPVPAVPTADATGRSGATR
jgi:hypothetical protein